jgi:hypothetical protein
LPDVLLGRWTFFEETLKTFNRQFLIFFRWREEQRTIAVGGDGGTSRLMSGYRPSKRGPGGERLAVDPVARQGAFSGGWKQQDSPASSTDLQGVIV